MFATIALEEAGICPDARPHLDQLQARCVRRATIESRAHHCCSAPRAIQGAGVGARVCAASGPRSTCSIASDNGAPTRSCTATCAARAIAFRAGRCCALAQCGRRPPGRRFSFRVAYPDRDRGRAATARPAQKRPSARLRARRGGGGNAPAPPCRPAIPPALEAEVARATSGSAALLGPRTGGDRLARHRGDGADRAQQRWPRGGRGAECRRACRHRAAHERRRRRRRRRPQRRRHAISRA